MCEISAHVCSCANPEQKKSALETAQQLEQVSEELVNCAQELRNSMSDQDSEEHHLAIEKAEILRRDWAAKVGVRQRIIMASCTIAAEVMHCMQALATPLHAGSCESMNTRHANDDIREPNNEKGALKSQCIWH